MTKKQLKKQCEREAATARAKKEEKEAYTCAEKKQKIPQWWQLVRKKMAVWMKSRLLGNFDTFSTFYFIIITKHHSMNLTMGSH